MYRKIRVISDAVIYEHTRKHSMRRRSCEAHIVRLLHFAGGTF
jgi:hypothetical protein